MRVLLVGLLILSTLAGTIPGTSATPAPGPDAFGYTVRDSENSYLPFEWEAIENTEGAVRLMPAYTGYNELIFDMWASQQGSTSWPYPWEMLELPFAFEFYGDTYDKFTLNENGLLTFTDPGNYWDSWGTNSPPSSLPTSKSPPLTIAPAWSAFDFGYCTYWYSPPAPPPHDVWVKTVGETPFRKVIVQWTGMTDIGYDWAQYPCNNPKQSTFQAVLDECGGGIEFLYKSMATTKPVTAGIYKDSTAGLEYYVGSSPADLEGKRVRFALNDCPIAMPDVATVYEDQHAPVLVLLNDRDPEGEPLKVVAVGSSSGAPGVSDLGGTVELGPAGVFVYYTGPKDQHQGTLGQPDTFTYTVSDPGGKLAVQTATINIIPRNDPPRLMMGPPILTTEDGPLEAVTGWAAPDEIVPGPADELGQTIVSYAAEAEDASLFAEQPTFDATGTVRFRTAPDVCTDSAGTPVHILMADDGGNANGGRSANRRGEFTVPVVIACETDDPVAVADAPGPVTVGTTGASTTVLPLANDHDPDMDQPGGDYVTLMAVEGASRGTATIDATRTQVQYTTAQGVSGPDRLRYRIVDATGHPSNWANIDLRFVCPTLILQPDFFEIEEGEVLTRPPTGLLGNDHFGATGDLAISVFEQGALGVTTMGNDGSFTYTPNESAIGVDTFRYRVQNTLTGCQDVVQVTVTILDVNDPPTAVADSYTLPEDSIAVELDVLRNDSSLPDVGEPMPTLFDATAEKGRAEVRFGKLLYSAPPDWSGEDHVVYTIKDARAGTANGVATITLTPVQDEPRGVADSVTVRPGRPARLGTVLDNDSDPDGDAITAQLLTQPSYGSVSLTPDGTLTIVPDRTFLGDDVFQYVVWDTGGLRSPPVPVHITVAGNEAPVASFTTSGGQVAVGATVAFTDTSEDADGFLVGHQWDFGDGESSTESSPVHVYADSGHYTVRLQVVDNDGRLATATAELEVVDGYDTDHGGVLGARLPVVDAGPDQDAFERAAVRLEAAMVEGDHESAKWRQVEGPPVALDADGLTATFNAPALGASPGPVRLAFEVTVFDGVRTSLPDMVIVDVYTPQRPPTVPAVVAGPDREAVPGERIELVASFSNVPDGQGGALLWQQVDGPTVGVMPAGARVFVSVPDAVGRSVTFRASGEVLGKVYSDDVTVHVTSSELRDGFLAERGRGRSTGTVVFTPLVEGKHAWTFGDGATSLQQAPTHTYAESGAYTATLEVTDQDGVQRTYTKEIRVHAVAGEDASKESPAAPFAFALLAIAVALRRRR